MYVCVGSHRHSCSCCSAAAQARTALPDDTFFHLDSLHDVSHLGVAAAAAERVPGGGGHQPRVAAPHHVVALIHPLVMGLLLLVLVLMLLLRLLLLRVLQHRLLHVLHVHCLGRSATCIR